MLRVCRSVAGPWLLFTLVVYVFAFAGGFVQTWGRDYTFTLNHFRTAFSLEWGEFGLVWAGNPDHAGDRHRSLSRTDIAPLLAIPGINCPNGV